MPSWLYPPANHGQYHFQGWIYQLKGALHQRINLQYKSTEEQVMLRSNCVQGCDDLADNPIVLSLEPRNLQPRAR